MSNIDTALSEVLLERELIDRGRLDSLAKESKDSDRSFVSILIREGVVSEEKISDLLRERFNISYINLKKTSIDRSVVERVPLKIASYYKFVPVKIEDRTLTIAVASSLDVKTRDDIRTYLGFDIKMVLSAEDDINEMLDHHYGLAAETIEKMSGDMSGKEAVWTALEEKVEDIEKLAEDASVIKLVNQVILEAFKRRATDIHIEPYRGKVKFRYRVDGVLYDIKMPEEIKHFLMPILSRIKIMANMNIVERRLPQDGRAVVKIQDQVLDLRISSIPTPYGESIVIRILPMTLLFNLEKLGMSHPYTGMFRELIRRPHGIVFITGPTGSGKTTTLYACLSEINSPERKIITIEDPIEYEMEGITQIQVSADTGLDFARGLRSILRHDPNVVMVGEVRDLETAEIAIRASLTGHLVFSTLHTNDAASGITRLVDIGVEPYLVASSLEAIVAQRLVRMICPDCKREDDEKKAELKAAIADDLGLASVADVRVYKGTGCERCSSTGFYGRTAIYEVLLLNESIRNLIMKKSSSNDIKKQAMSCGMRTLRHDGWQKVIAGLTTIEEVMNVAPEDKEKVVSKVVEPAPAIPKPAVPPAPETITIPEPPLPSSAPEPIPSEPAPPPSSPPKQPLSHKPIGREETPDTSISQRIYKRVEKKVAIRYKILTDKSIKMATEGWSPTGKADEEKEHATTTKDISAGGALFYADNFIPRTSKMEIKIELPDDGSVMMCLARVERVEELKKDAIYSIAVCFLDMARSDRVRIDKYIKKAESEGYN